MKITLSSSTPSQFETECLVVAVVDAAEKSENGAADKPSHRSSPTIPPSLPLLPTSLAPAKSPAKRWRLRSCTSPPDSRRSACC